MSYPKKAKGSGGGGGVNGNGGVMLRMALFANFTLGQDEFSKVPFDLMPINTNDRFDWTEQYEVGIKEAGTVMFAASVGAVMDVNATNEITVVGWLFKNGQPLRQKSNTRTKGPYCIAEVVAIDECMPGDKYTIYVNANGGDNQDITIASSNNGVTMLEVSYL